MSHEEAVRADAGRDRVVSAVLTVVLVSATLYFARIVFEPVAFVLFALALVWPFQKAVETRIGKPIALTLTILLTPFVISILLWAIVWSIGDVGHWARFALTAFNRFTRGQICGLKGKIFLHWTCPRALIRPGLLAFFGPLRKKSIILRALHL